MGNPTPKTPIIVNDDGSVSMLVYLGRTFELVVVYKGLMDATGYKARLGFTDKYGNPLLASANSEDGSVTFADYFDPEPPNAQLGMKITSVITDELWDDVEAKGGKVDLVLEEPGGKEIPLVVGDWVAWKRVTP